jgi:hypothetical protein
MQHLITRRRARNRRHLKGDRTQVVAKSSLNPLWPRPVPPVLPDAGGASPYVAEEIRAYVEARIAARDAGPGGGE